MNIRHYIYALGSCEDYRSFQRLAKGANSGAVFTGSDHSHS
ncbi:hypothetical protein PA08_2726 [Cutibacterium modestum P08]|nr:hypothetical protein PA08_2726 [Cutibacterium modestum P08]MCW5114228.1 hypothetical protein [Cutibacterium acnes P05]